MKNTLSKNDYLVSFLRKAISLLSTVIFTSFLSRYLGPQLKGEYTYFFSIVHILVIVSQFGFFNLYPSFKRENPEAGDSFFTIVVLKFALLLLASFGLSFLTWHIFSSWLYFWLPFVVCLNALQAELLFFLLVDRIRKFNCLQIVLPLVNALSVVLLYFFFRANLSVTIALFCIKDFLTVIFCFLLNPKRISFSNTTIDVFKKSLKIVAFPIICALLLDLNYKIDVFFIKGYLNEYSVGIYSAAVAVSEMAWQIPDVFKEVLFNRVAKSDSTKEINMCLRFSNTITLLVLAALVVFGRLVIRVFYGNDYIEAYPALVVLLVGVFSMSIFKILNPLIQATNRWLFYTSTLLIAVVVNVVLNFILVPSLQQIGAAIASVASYSVCGLMLLTYYMVSYKVSIGKVCIVTISDFKEIGRWFSKK